MSDKESKNESKLATVTGGTSISGLLGIAFIILKLCKVINWSWWWVLAPFWIPSALIALIYIIVLTVFLVKDKFNK